MLSYIKFLLPGLLLMGCGAPDTAPAPEEKAAAAGAQDQITLTETQVRQAGIAWGGFEKKPLSDFLAVAAELSVDKSQTATLSAFSDGILVELRARNGQQVAKGAVLAVIQKPDLLDLQQQFLENRDRLAFLQSEYERYRSLKAADATAAKNAVKAEAEWKAAQTAAKALAAKLRQFQIDPEQLSADRLHTEIALRSPIGGTVSAVLANVGTSLTPGTPVLELTDFTQVHPVLYVFEKDLHKIKMGQKVKVYFPGQNSLLYDATIYLIERSVDPERKSVRVHARLSARPPEQFAIGAYMEARILLDQAEGVPALPKEAVIREGDFDYIFIWEKEDASGTTFRKVKVKTGASDQQFVAVQTETPLAPDVRIALRGAYYVSAQGAGIEVEE